MAPLNLTSTDFESLTPRKLTKGQATVAIAGGILAFVVLCCIGCCATMIGSDKRRDRRLRDAENMGSPIPLQDLPPVNEDRPETPRPPPPARRPRPRTWTEYGRGLWSNPPSLADLATAAGVWNSRTTDEQRNVEGNAITLQPPPPAVIASASSSLGVETQARPRRQSIQRFEDNRRHGQVFDTDDGVHVIPANWPAQAESPPSGSGTGTTAEILDPFHHQFLPSNSEIFPPSTIAEESDMEVARATTNSPRSREADSIMRGIGTELTENASPFAAGQRSGSRRPSAFDDETYDPEDKKKVQTPIDDFKSDTSPSFRLDMEREFTNASMVPPPLQVGGTKPAHGPSSPTTASKSAGTTHAQAVSRPASELIASSPTDVQSGPRRERPISFLSNYHLPRPRTNVSMQDRLAAQARRQMSSMSPAEDIIERSRLIHEQRHGKKNTEDVVMKQARDADEDSLSDEEVARTPLYTLEPTTFQASTQPAQPTRARESGGEGSRTGGIRTQRTASCRSALPRSQDPFAAGYVGGHRGGRLEQSLASSGVFPPLPREESASSIEAQAGSRSGSPPPLPPRTSGPRRSLRHTARGLGPGANRPSQ
ncbi:hypothetical protein F4808DRAFT_461728 [Astrocystis sublimbata]|nr:hypothetical protein F4808DRAFT_461728 [Astrocystis sublimbata]